MSATSILALLSGLAWSTAASAQSAPPASASGPSNSSTVQEVVVTAERRSESAQNVPISLSVIAAETAQTMGVTDNVSLSGKVPSLTTAAFGPQSYFLRGVGTTGSSANIEQSVASYIDGIYLYAGFSSRTTLSGIDHVEVLKGPQGTLFGRNTTGGAIQMVTRDPTRGPSLEGSVGYSSFDTISASGYASTNVSDTLAVGLAVDYNNQREGWGTNTTTRQDTFKSKTFSVQGKAVYTPTDDTKVTGFLWYNEYHDAGPGAKIAPGSKGVDNVLRNIGFYDAVNDMPEKGWYRSALGYVRWDQNLGFADLAVISSYRDVKARLALDGDYVPIAVANARWLVPLKNFSQEVQLLSPPSDKLKWVVGAYYFKARTSYEPITFFGAAGGPAGQIEYYREQKTESAALYGQGTYEILPETRLTVGVRYTDETEKKPAGLTTSRGVLVGMLEPQQVDSSGWTWRIGLDHKFNDDLMGYATYNRGLKSGGVPLVAARNLPVFQPEQIDAYEVGLKAELLEHRVRINSAAFFYSFKDIQINRISSGAVQIANAAAAEIYGADTDVEAHLIDNVTLFGTLGYTHGEYTKYPDAVAYIPRPTGGAAATLFNGDGQSTIYTPRWSGSIGGTYKHDISYGTIIADAFVQYASKQYVAPDNLLAIPQYTVVNASLAWRMPDHDLTVRLWARNLFDKKYLNQAIESTTGYAVVPAAPRTVGVTLSAKY